MTKKTTVSPWKRAPSKGEHKEFDGIGVVGRLLEITGNTGPYVNWNADEPDSVYIEGRATSQQLRDIVDTIDRYREYRLWVLRSPARHIGG
jgi:hypothetical protein